MGAEAARSGLRGLWPRPPLGDVVVRARGLATRLLPHGALLQLARASGVGALGRALEDAGYWPAPSTGAPAPSTARALDRAIDHASERRLGLLARWLGERSVHFAPLLELEEVELLRIRVRELATGETTPERDTTTGRSATAWPSLRELTAAMARAGSLDELLRGLRKAESPYAAPLAAARRRHGDDPRRLETALDRAWAERAREAVRGADPALRSWVEDEIDLHNAWGALAGGGGSAAGDAVFEAAFLPGGRRLSREQWRAVAGLPDTARRRARLAEHFQEGSLAGVFDDPDPGVERLEARARAARIAWTRRAARQEPIGASAVVEVVLRLWAERADLRGIRWGVAAGLSPDTIASRLVPAP